MSVGTGCPASTAVREVGRERNLAAVGSVRITVGVASVAARDRTSTVGASRGSARGRTRVVTESTVADCVCQVGLAVGLIRVAVACPLRTHRNLTLLVGADLECGVAGQPAATAVRRIGPDLGLTAVVWIAVAVGVIGRADRRADTGRADGRTVRVRARGAAASARLHIAHEIRLAAIGCDVVTVARNPRRATRHADPARAASGSEGGRALESATAAAHDITRGRSLAAIGGVAVAIGITDRTTDLTLARTTVGGAVTVRTGGRTCGFDAAVHPTVD
jgi:hypothetical protein